MNQSAESLVEALAPAAESGEEVEVWRLVRTDPPHERPFSAQEVFRLSSFVWLMWPALLLTPGAPVHTRAWCLPSTVAI